MKTNNKINYILNYRRKCRLRKGTEVNKRLIYQIIIGNNSTANKITCKQLIIFDIKISFN